MSVPTPKRRKGEAPSTPPLPAEGVEDAPPGWGGTPARRWPTVVALAMGVALWLGFTPGIKWQLAGCWPALPVFAVLAVPAVWRRVVGVADRLRTPSARARRITFLGLSVGAVAFLLAVALGSGRALVPKWHDEMSYLIQMQMLSIGRLWLPPLVLPKFFDAYHLLVTPVYASMYFPGTALAYVWTVPLGLPGWAGPLATCGATVGVTYLLVRRLVDGLAAWAVALALPAVALFRWSSVYILSQPITTLLAVTAAWAYLRWSERRTAGRAAVLGAVCGWGAITRPLDAVCFAVPLAVLMLVDLARRPWRQWATAIGPAVAAGLPFLLLQVVLNVGATGDWTRSPYAVYHDRNYPSLLPGFHNLGPDPVDLETAPPQKRRFYDEYVAPAIVKHRPGGVAPEFLDRRLPALLATTLPSPILAVFLPVGLLAAADRRILAVLAVLVLLPLAYTFYALFSAHYLDVVVPACLLLAALGVGQVARAFPSRWARAAVVSLAAGATIGMLPGLNRGLTEDALDARELVHVDRVLDAIPGPALVLIRYSPLRSVHIEPVYNFRDPHPDLARVVRAHDRGPDNARIVRYYGELQPERRVYHYDRGTGSLTDLGTAGDLMRGSPPRPTAGP